MLPASSAGGACEEWKMLGVYEPTIWRAKTYRTFRQIPTFVRVIFHPVFKLLPQILPSVPRYFFGGREFLKAHFRKHSNEKYITTAVDASTQN